METLTPHPTETELFQHYLAQRMENGGRQASVDDLVSEFREYQRQFDDLKAKLHEGQDSIARGEAKPLGIEEFLTELSSQWSAQGIPE